MDSENNEDSFLNIYDIKNMMPHNWNFELLDLITYGTNPTKTEALLKVALFNPEDIKLWIHELEEKTYCTYSIKSTDDCAGKVVLYKQRLYCHHNTRCKEIRNPSLKNRTRNMNCPSKLIITLRAVNKKFRGNPVNAPDPKMPCIISFVATHNHSIGTADALRFRRVAGNVRNKLIDLYNSGHTPATALKSLKMDIQLENENYEQLLADRSVCPDYNYCHHLFMTEFKKQNKVPDVSFFVEEIHNYNKKYDEESAEINSQENNQAAIEEGRNTIANISKRFETFLDQSPREALAALKVFEQKINKIKTTKALVSSLSTFPSARHKYVESRIYNKPSTIARQRILISNKRRHVVGGLRKESKPKNKVVVVKCEPQ